MYIGLRRPTDTMADLIDMKLEPKPQSEPAAAASVYTFTVPEKFTPKQVIEDMAKHAQFLNKYTGALLTSGVLSAANPATAGLLQASATLEQAATQQVQQLHQLMAQQQAMGGGLVGPGQGGPQGPQGPQRFN
jgi:hypothetical protein